MCPTSREPVLLRKGAGGVGWTDHWRFINERVVYQVANFPISFRLFCFSGRLGLGRPQMKVDLAGRAITDFASERAA